MNEQSLIQAHAVYGQCVFTERCKLRKSSSSSSLMQHTHRYRYKLIALNGIHTFPCMDLTHTHTHKAGLVHVFPVSHLSSESCTLFHTRKWRSVSCCLVPLWTMLTHTHTPHSHYIHSHTVGHKHPPCLSFR